MLNLGKPLVAWTLLSSMIRHLHRDMGSKHFVGPDPKGVTAGAARSQDCRMVRTEDEIFAVHSGEAEGARSGLVEVIPRWVTDE